MKNISRFNESRGSRGSGGSVGRERQSDMDFWIQFRTAEMIIYCNLVPVVIFANLLIILVVKRMKSGRKPTDILVASLAVSDLLVGAVVLPLDVGRHLETLWMDKPTSVIFFCYFEYSVYLQPLCWSIQNMFLVALECLTSIVKPIWHRVHVNNVLAVRVAIASWIFGAIYFILPYFLLPLGLKKRDCARAETLNTTFITIYPNAIFIITIVLHLAILITSKLVIKNHLATGARARIRSLSEVFKRHLKHVIFALFVLCWGPVSIGVLITEFGEITELDNVIMRILLMLAHFNSFLNCIVYLLKSTRFRQEAKKIFRLRRNQVGVEVNGTQRTGIKTISGSNVLERKPVTVTNSTGGVLSNTSTY